MNDNKLMMGYDGADDRQAGHRIEDYDNHEIDFENIEMQGT